MIILLFSTFQGPRILDEWASNKPTTFARGNGGVFYAARGNFCSTIGGRSLLDGVSPEMTMKTREEERRNTNGSKKIVLTSLSAMVAETSTFPIDLIKTRLQLHGESQSSSLSRRTNGFKVASGSSETTAF